MCSFSRETAEETECHSDFSHSLTEQGICSTKNMPKFDGLYNNNKYINKFKNAFKIELGDVAKIKGAGKK